MKTANQLVLDSSAVNFISRDESRARSRSEILKNDLVADAIGFLIAFSAMAGSWIYVALTSRV